MPVDEPSSPACLAHDADDAYMGFATADEIARFREKLAAAPAGAKAGMLREMLPKIRNDVIHAELSSLLARVIGAESTT